MTLLQRTLASVAPLAIAACLAAGPAAAAEKLNVVASFSILGDMASRVGGDRVAVTTLVGPDGDAHVFQPAPADAKRLADADLIVINGLGFEGWLPRLIEAAGIDVPIAVATSGITQIPNEEDDHGGAEPEGHDHDHAAEGEAAHAGHDHDDAEPAGHDHDDAEPAGHDHDHDHAAEGEAAAEEHGHDHGAFDPHGWQNLANGAIYADNIAEGLCAIDNDDCDGFKANAAAYRAEIEALDADIRARVAAVPEARRIVITSHDAFGYFADAYGIKVIAPQGVSTDAEASAADVANLIRQIRETGAKALFVENIADPRLIEQIASETGVVIGGRLYSDALSPPDGPAPTYLAMIRHNAELMFTAMAAE
ncbi:metal ABC transporter solute-binding protein, Zn/Mn family [Methylobrevis albus]|uniref:Zinc ABC transporter substrate-binding protein n=1 Tax=Methylobrevis albus TaxID=2793297 RepID=A0A931I321_9HYPH|nr:zinc ABC transporter substrate-binding protein [Methylobrevis albus]MBH0239325.1 zinc ABC transporter substrate-binding protein [Methylobrevis albus]